MRSEAVQRRAPNLDAGDVDFDDLVGTRIRDQQAGGGIDVGSTVVAVGHPFGLVNSLTEGVVSGLGRSATADDGQVLSDLMAEALQFRSDQQSLTTPTHQTP